MDFNPKEGSNLLLSASSVLINLKKTAVDFYSTVRGYEMDSVTMGTQMLTTKGRCQCSVEYYGAVQSNDWC